MLTFEESARGKRNKNMWRISLSERKTRSLFSASPFSRSPSVYTMYTDNNESSGALHVGKYVFKGTFVFVVNVICRGDY